MTDRDFLVVCAVRYCLGRQSYVVGMMADYLVKNAKAINSSDRRVILEDIDSQAKYGYGDKCDEVEWMRAKAALKAVGRASEQERS